VPGLADDPRFAANAGRTANRDQLRPLLAQQLAARPASEWFGALTGVGVPCGPINTVDGGIAFAREIGLDPVVIAGEGEAGVPTIRHPVTYSVTPPSYPLPPPGLDEHGDQIRAWLAPAPGTHGTGQHETGARP
jgi:crotonobetainyl-CoA:carnitine CoA-transferase CaiB-like acyl-CoA transferase